MMTGNEVIRTVLSDYGLRMITALITLVVGWLIAKVVRGVLRRSLQAARMDATLCSFLTSLVYVVLLALVVIAALHGLGFPTVSFAAVVGAAGLAIGLALKGTLSNLAAGVILIALRPFAVGDRIEAAGVTGVVKTIQVFATTIEADDGRQVIIPNGKITDNTISNYTNHQKSKSR